MKRRWFTSFSMSARMIGAGKPKRSLSPLMVSVLVTDRRKVPRRKAFSKFSRPTHSLPKMPLVTMKSLKAMTIPPMGIYLKIKK